MNPEQTRSAEDRFDSALQRVIEGSPVEDVMAAYGFLKGEEAEALLRAAGAVREGPHPSLPSASLAAIVARAQAQARAQTNRRALIVDGFRDEEPAALLPPLATASPPARVRPQTTRAGKSWGTRFSGLFRRTSPALRLAWAFALILALYAGVLTFARINNQSPIIPVPTFSGVPFYYDAMIEQVTPGRWTIGGYAIEIDKTTRITGNPVIGAQAHVEGQILPGNRRVAKTIRVLSSPPLSPTVVTGQVTPTPTGLAEISGGPMLTARETSAPAAVITPETGGLSDGGTPPMGKTPSSVDARTTPTTAPSFTPTPRGAGAGSIAAPTPTRTSTRPATATLTPRPTNTAAPTATRTPIPTHTGTPVPTLTRTPVPTFTPLATTQPSATITPTSEPDETLTPEPTTEPDETETPEATVPPALTFTPRPTRTPDITPTSVPSRTATEESTHEPEETETVPVSTWTPQPTQTHEPGETHTPDPDETHGPEGTRSPEPSPTR